MAQRNKRARRGRRVDATGRSIGEPRHVRLYHWLLKTSAWQSLSPQGVATYVALSQIYNGSNNGEIALSVRAAARQLHIAKDTATKAFYELEAKGFIHRNVCGSFNWKLRHATTWVLTEHTFNDQPATKDFVRWPTEKSEPGPDPGTNCPKQGTQHGLASRLTSLIVPALGLWAQFCTALRSQTTARI